MSVHQKTTSTRTNLSTATLEGLLVLVFGWKLVIDAEIYNKVVQASGERPNFAPRKVNLRELMSRKIRIKKGADIRLKGRPTSTVDVAASTATCAVQPPNYHGITPKLEVKEGSAVEVGTPLFFSKESPAMKFLSPVSGTVKSILRGEKRRILAVIVESDDKNDAVSLDKIDVLSASADVIRDAMLSHGMFPFLEQRPFADVANPADMPRSIHVSGFDSAPLAPDMEIVLKDRMEAFQNGIHALSSLVGGQAIHLGIRSGQTIYNDIQKVELTAFEGPHPAGNVGVQVHHTKPINKGETLWTMHAEDVANLGETLVSGVYTSKRTIAATGSEHPDPRYLQTHIGCELSSLTNGLQNDSVRVISGNPLTGTHAAADGYLGGLDHQVTLLPEGRDPKFLLTAGWLSPGLDRFSLSKSYPTWLLPKSKEFVMDTNTGGEERAFVVTGQYEPVFPFDIYPVQLIKSIMANDIDAMEKLGIYEVAPEDFALCEYACTSKIDVQDIVREGLDNLKKELG